MQIENDLEVNPVYQIYHEVENHHIYQNTERRKETLLMILQELESLGFEQTIKILEKESQTSLNQTIFQDLKEKIQQGNYEQVLLRIGELQLNEKNENTALFYIYQQVYLELISEYNFKDAVYLLQNKLSNHIQDTEHFHRLAGLLICKDGMREVAQKLGLSENLSEQRKQLYNNILHLTESLFTPQNFFDTILQQSFEFQCINCPTHNEQQQFQTSLIDHRCDQKDPPVNLAQTISGFDDEVWLLKFSNKGDFIACGTKKNSLYIIQIKGVEIINWKKIANAHSKEINSISWNPKDTRIITSGGDNVINLYCTTQKQLLLKIKRHRSAILTAVFNPVNGNIFSGGVDNWIGIWNDKGDFIDEIQTKIVKNILFTQDNKKMIVQYTSQMYLSILDPQNKYQQIGSILESDLVTNSCISQDEQYLLLNISHKKPELHLWNLKSLTLYSVFKGYQQTQYQLECSFVGDQDYFIGIGSEDGKLFFYHKNNPKVIKDIKAHKGIISTIQWKGNILATGSDDKTIKFWKVSPNQINNEFIIEDGNQSSSNEDN